jgi:alkylhydroperoxidase family enzyme
MTAVDPSEATGKTKELLETHQQRLGRIPNMLGLMAHSPSVLSGYLAFTYAVQETALPASLRNQLALLVAEATGSPYFMALAEGFAFRDGLDAEFIAAARRGEARDPRAAVALRYAAKLVQERGHLPVDEGRALRQAGFSNREIVEIVTLVGLNLFRSYFNLALDTKMDVPPHSLIGGR